MNSSEEFNNMFRLMQSGMVEGLSSVCISMCSML